MKIIERDSVYFLSIDDKEWELTTSIKNSGSIRHHLELEIDKVKDVHNVDTFFRYDINSYPATLDYIDGRFWSERYKPIEFITVYFVNPIKIEFECGYYEAEFIRDNELSEFTEKLSAALAQNNFQVHKTMKYYEEDKLFGRGLRDYVIFSVERKLEGCVNELIYKIMQDVKLIHNRIEHNIDTNKSVATTSYSEFRGIVKIPEYKGRFVHIDLPKLWKLLRHILTNTK